MHVEFLSKLLEWHCSSNGQSTQQDRCESVSLGFSNIMKLCIISKFHVYQKKIQNYTSGGFKKNRWMVDRESAKSNPTGSHSFGGWQTLHLINPSQPWTLPILHFISFKIWVPARKRRRHKQASKRDRIPSSPIKSASEQPQKTTPFLPVRPPPSTPPVGGASRRWWPPGSAPVSRAVVFHGSWVASKV